MSAVNEALRSAEQVVLKRRDAEPGLRRLNVPDAAEEENIVPWGSRHRVSLKPRFTFKAGAALAVFVGFQLLDIFKMWRDEKVSQYRDFEPYLLEDIQGAYTLHSEIPAPITRFFGSIFDPDTFPHYFQELCDGIPSW